MAAQKSLKILLVHAKESCGLLLKEELHNYAKHEVEIAVSFEQATARLSAGGDPFDLFIVDYWLENDKPGTGMIMVEWIKEHFPETEIILVNLYPHLREIDHCYRVSAVWISSSDPSELLQIIEELFAPKE